MLTIEQIRAALKDSNLAAVAGASHVSYNSIRQLMTAENPSPKFETVKKLSLYLESRGYCGADNGVA